MNLRYLRFVIWIFLCPTWVTAQLTGKVVSVADGDTFTLLNGTVQTRIRLHGIDCPEKGQDFSNVAKDFLSALVFEQAVKVDVKDTDRYGRTIGIVYVQDSINVNVELLKAGLAWHYRYYDQNPVWAALEATARKAKRHIWSLPDPVAPWDFRKAKAGK